MNLVLLWEGIFVAITFSRLLAFYVTTCLGLPPLPPSPLRIPGVSLEGYLNDFLIILATLVMYQSIHTKLSGLSQIMEG